MHGAVHRHILYENMVCKHTGADFHLLRLYFAYFLFFLPSQTRSPIAMLTSPTPIKMAQSMKKFWGRTRMMGSRYQSKTQLVLPGKKMLWNSTKKRSKSSAARPPIMIGAVSDSTAAQKQAECFPSR